MGGRITDPGRLFHVFRPVTAPHNRQTHMNENTTHPVWSDPEHDALNRARRVFDIIVRRVFVLMDAAEDGDSSAPRAVLAKLGDLQRAYLDVKKAEEVFNDKTGLTQTGEINFAELRQQIGRRLDSLRDARGTD